MRKPFALAVLLGAMTAATSAHAADGFMKGPYLQNVSGDAATVMWQSQRAIPGTLVVTMPDGTDRRVDSPAGRFHEVRIGGLTASTRHPYRVETEDGQARGELTTAPTRDEPFSFVVFGDNRSNAQAHHVLAERVRREVPDFILGTGDMANDGGSEADWQQFFDAERDLMRNNVLFPTLGNHDRQGRNKSTNYEKYFAVPAASSDAGERYYAFTWGNSRFVVLDSNLYNFALVDQTSWLERELAAAHADPDIAHVFVTMHHPPYSISIHGGHEELREMWTPLFEKYRVDAVFSGHDHCYSRGESMGVRYLVSGGGGAPLYPRDPRPAPEDARAVRYFERVYNYLRIQVAGDFVELAAMRHDGTLIESVSWGALPAAPESPVVGASRPAQGAVKPSGALGLAETGGTNKDRQARACAIGAGSRAPLAGTALLFVAALAALARRRRS